MTAFTTIYTLYPEKYPWELLNTEMLGKTMISNACFEHPNGSPITIDTDYFGNPPDKSNPTPGLFEGLSKEKQPIKIWPKD